MDDGDLPRIKNLLEIECGAQGDWSTVAGPSSLLQMRRELKMTKSICQLSSNLTVIDQHRLIFRDRFRLLSMYLIAVVTSG